MTLVAPTDVPEAVVSVNATAIRMHAQVLALRVLELATEARCTWDAVLRDLGVPLEDDTGEKYTLVEAFHADAAQAGKRAWLYEAEHGILDTAQYKSGIGL